MADDDENGVGKPAFRRKWTPEEILQAKGFIEQSEPGLWPALIKIKKSGLDFIYRPETTRALGLISSFNPNHRSMENVDLWLGLVRLMREEIDSDCAGTHD